MNRQDFSGLVISIVFFFLIVVVLAPEIASLSPGPPMLFDVGAALWKGRTFEVFLQGVILLVGAMAILLLLGQKVDRGDHP